MTNHYNKSQLRTCTFAFSDLCDALNDAIEAGNPTTIEVCGESRPLRWLLGQLWNCQNIMPGVYCDELELRQGSTYAKAVRHLARSLTS